MTASTSEASTERQAASRWRSFSTELKIFLALFIGLSPLGLLGVIATLKGNETADRDRLGLTRVANTELSRRLGTELSADRAVLRRNMVGVPLAALFPEEARRICVDVKTALAQPDIAPPRIFIISDSFSRELCPEGGTDYFATESVSAVPVEGLLAIDGQTDRLLSSVRFDEQATPYSAVLSYAPENLLAIAEGDVNDLPPHNLAIVGQGGRLDLTNAIEDSFAVTTRETDHPIGRSGHSLVMTTYNASLSRTALVSLLSPVAIWFLGALLSWGLLGFLIMRPLSRLHRSVAAYRPGAVFLRPRHRRAAAREIVQLEQDFSALSETVAADKAELAKGLQQQMALTREVHHRVKNNLQVIASLINLHSRGATQPEAANAYRTIQRRVDAIAVVHRNHLAGGEDSLGHALQPLLSELASNLRASGTDEAPIPQISVAVEELYVRQDIAVPIAFLITEVVELSSLCQPAEPISIRAERIAQSDDLARLTIQSDGLIACQAFDERMVARYERILTGLSRQLRKPFDHQPDAGFYSIELPVYPRFRSAP